MGEMPQKYIKPCILYHRSLRLITCREPLGLESFDPELTTEGLEAEKPQGRTSIFMLICSTLKPAPPDFSNWEASSKTGLPFFQQICVPTWQTGLLENFTLHHLSVHYSPILTGNVKSQHLGQYLTLTHKCKFPILRLRKMDFLSNALDSYPYSFCVCDPGPSHLDRLRSRRDGIGKGVEGWEALSWS